MSELDAKARARLLRETLVALDMPPAGLREWFGQMRTFCDRHGGEHTYGELLGLLGECDATLNTSEG
jgi:hypothetical protein